MFDDYKFTEAGLLLFDKLSIVSFKADLDAIYAVYKLTSEYNFTYRGIVNAFNIKNEQMGDFTDFISSYNDLKNLSNDVNFDIIYAQVKEFCLTFYKHNLDGKGNAYWGCVERQWAC